MISKGKLTIHHSIPIIINCEIALTWKFYYHFQVKGISQLNEVLV